MWAGALYNKITISRISRKSHASQYPVDLFNTHSAPSYADLLSSPITSDEKSIISGRNIWCESLNVLVLYNTKFHPNFKKVF